jgi:hypothetical protein
MRETLDRLANPLHLAIAAGAIALLVSAPWLGMYHTLPQPPGAVNLAHVVVGLALLPLALLYVASCTLDGRWRLYYPWLAGDFAGLRADLAGLVRGRRPGSEAGGLFAALEGLLLVALLIVVLTGLFWWLARGGDAAVSWRAAHIAAAHAFAVLLVLHVIAVSLHLVDLVRD